MEPYECMNCGQVNDALDSQLACANCHDELQADIRDLMGSLAARKQQVHEVLEENERLRALLRELWKCGHCIFCPAHVGAIHAARSEREIAEDALGREERILRSAKDRRCEQEVPGARARLHESEGSGDADR